MELERRVRRQQDVPFARQDTTATKRNNVWVMQCCSAEKEPRAVHFDTDQRQVNYTSVAVS